MGLRERKKEQTRQLIAPQIAANALIGVQRALVDYTRRRVLADEEPIRLAADVRGLCQRAFALLEHGLGDYATKPARPTHTPPATRSPKVTAAEGTQ